MMRSKLFVPGSRPELFAKAMNGPADAISIDLEDAVLESRKSEARQIVGDFLREQNADSTSGKLVIVRINDITTRHFEADIAAVAWPALHAINLPKAESPKMVRAVAELLDRFEAERGITRRIGILANIESPKGLSRAAKIAGASRRLIGLQIGFGDLFEPLSMDRKNAEAVHQVQLAVRFAAARGNLPAYDGAFSDVSNPDGYLAEAMHARRLGYAGKSCIHPSQVAMANDVFRPSEEEIGFAQRVLAAWVDAERLGMGAITVEGRMIDKPFVERARLITAAAQAGT